MKRFIVILVIIFGAGALVFVGYNMGNKPSTQTNNAGSSNSTVANSSAKVLDLSNQGLTKVGPEVYNKTSTTNLILSNNLLASLPSEMGKMDNLVVLKLDHNKLQGSLIGEIRKMTKLKELDASFNNMTGVPAEIGQLTNLEDLNLSNNGLTGLPNELKNATSLKVINLSNNKVSASTIAELQKALPNTQIIY